MYFNWLKNGENLILSETWRLVCICDHLLFHSFEFMNWSIPDSMIWIPLLSCNGMTWEHWSSFSYFVQKYNTPSHLYHVVFTFMSHDKSPQKKVHHFESCTSSSLTPWKHCNLSFLYFFSHSLSCQINTLMLIYFIFFMIQPLQSCENF